MFYIFICLWRTALGYILYHYFVWSWKIILLIDYMYFQKLVFIRLMHFSLDKLFRFWFKDRVICVWLHLFDHEFYITSSITFFVFKNITLKHFGSFSCTSIYSKNKEFPLSITYFRIPLVHWIYSSWEIHVYIYLIYLSLLYVNVMNNHLS